MTKGLTMRLIPALMMLGFAGAAGASGFAVQNQNGSGTGNAFAGAAAAAEDASTIYFNPAGMTYLEGTHNVSAAATVLSRSVDFSDRGTAARTLTITPPGVTVPVTRASSDGGDGGGTSVIPAGYYSYAVTPNLRVGLGVSGTFGNKTEFDDDFVGRFAGYYSSMKQSNINPSVAYKVNDMVSLGAGVSYAKNETHFKFALPTGQATQTYVDLKGDDSAWGYNFGAMFQLSPSTRVGLAYRSAIEFTLKGDFEVVGSSTSPAKVKIEMPDNFSIAVSQKLSDRWELLGDATWTGWSSVKRWDVYNRNSGTLLKSESFNFDDTWRVGLGANYKYNDAWKLRFGVAYDQSPVKHAADRTMTVPDSDRTWLSLGAKWQLSKAASVDFGYAHIFFKEAPTARQVSATRLSATTVANAQTVNGKFDVSADLFSVQYNHAF